MQQGLQTDATYNIWTTSLHPFPRGFRDIYHDFKQLLTIIHSVKIPSNIQYNARLSKGG